MKEAVGPISPRQVSFSGCVWRRQPLDVEGSSNNVE